MRENPNRTAVVRVIVDQESAVSCPECSGRPARVQRHTRVHDRFPQEPEGVGSQPYFTGLRAAAPEPCELQDKLIEAVKPVGMCADLKVS